MKYVVAVSGGVDSVVLLDMLVSSNEHELIVAHFDHGIRNDSHDDARFVAGLAKRYGLKYVAKREELGKNASEALARERRYEFLRSVANREDAQIVTAHHQDDIVETIAINISRGTGWRGLAVMGDQTITRPLRALTKADIYAYALKNSLEWVEDSTNLTDAYLRNRIRAKLYLLSDENRRRIIGLHESQTQLADEINQEVKRLPMNSRYFITMIDPNVASEILRSWLAENSISLTRPQRERLLHAVKTAFPGQIIEPGDGMRIEFGKREFIVKHPL